MSKPNHGNGATNQLRPDRTHQYKARLVATRSTLVFESLPMSKSRTRSVSANMSRLASRFTVRRSRKFTSTPGERCPADVPISTIRNRHLRTYGLEIVVARPVTTLLVTPFRPQQFVGRRVLLAPRRDDSWPKRRVGLRTLHRPGDRMGPQLTSGPGTTLPAKNHITAADRNIAMGFADTGHHQRRDRQPRRV